MPILTLVEGLPKYEGVNEAVAISDALNIMRKSVDGRRDRYLRIYPNTANKKSHFLKLLECKTDFLHISSHGSRIEGKTFLDITKSGKVSADDIRELDIKAKIIFLNACQTSRKDMANAFFKAGTYPFRYFIAPFKEIPFDEAFVVALLFYWKAFLKGVPLKNTKKLFDALEYAYKLKDISTNFFFWEPD